MDTRPGGGAYHRPIAPHDAPPQKPAPPIRLFLADVDGTLVTQDKVLTDDAVAAVRSLRQAGVLFALTSGRPPRGMEMLVDPLQIDTPIAAFNGGLMVDKDLAVLEEHAIPEDLVLPVVDHMKSFDLDVWLYRGADWYVHRPQGPARRPGGLDRQVRAQGTEDLRRVDRQASSSWSVSATTTTPSTEPPGPP